MNLGVPESDESDEMEVDAGPTPVSRHGWIGGQQNRIN